jgi:hypothetical protein
MPRRAETVMAPALPEKRDVSALGISLAGLGLMVLLAIALGGLWLIFSWQSSGPAIGFVRPDPAAELTKFRAAEQAKLDAFGWIDRKAGIARIPVKEAMALIAQRRTLPAWPATSGDAYCNFLESAVPRSPAVGDCTKSATAAPEKAP